MIRIILFFVLHCYFLAIGQEFPTDICALQKDIGRCKKYVEMYFYNKTDNSCQIFGWGGCGGNANKFDTLSECESSCKNGNPSKQMLGARKSSMPAQKQVFIGTLLDVNEVETDILDFEAGLGNWTTQNMKTVNKSELTNGLQSKKGEIVLMPNLGLSGEGKSELSKSYNIASDSNLEIDFALYVSGYNSSLAGALVDYNPSFSLHLKDESSSNNATAIDLERLNVPENAWKNYRFTIRNKEQESLKIIFRLSQGQGENNTIALDDIIIRWIPVLETEVNTLHKNILFSNTSAELPTDQVNSIQYQDSNNQTEIVTSPPLATTITTSTTTTQSLFEGLTIETINKAENETTTRTPDILENEQNVTHSSTNLTEATPGPTTSLTDNPAIFGPFNTTTTTTTIAEQQKNDSLIIDAQITTKASLPSNNITNTSTTEKSDSSKIVFPDTANNKTEQSTTPSTTQVTEKGKDPNTEHSETTKTTDRPEVTTAEVDNTNKVSNSSAIIAEPDAKQGSAYGYTAEVVLICLVVIFGLLFLLMVVKYYRLRTTIGDYQIQQGGRQTYDNPAFNGFGIQDSYRSR